MHRADVSEVVNACDAGREGELIFRFVYEMAGCKKPMRRLWISSMEDSAIKEGFTISYPRMQITFTTNSTGSANIFNTSLTTLYHIQGSISLLDCVHRINHFFKLLTLNLNTVSVHHYPVRDGIFFCQFPQLAFSDTEIFCCFFYGKSVLFPNRHVVIVQFVVPLS